MEEIGHAEFDQEHADSVVQANAIIDLCGNEAASETIVIAQRLETFIQGLDAHFKSEQGAMDAIDYSLRYVHQAEHDSVLNDLRHQQHCYQKSADVKALARFLQVNYLGWLETHTVTMDTLLAQALKK